MNPNNKDLSNKKAVSDYEADREAALRLMDDIPDVKPVNKTLSRIFISIFVALLVLPSLLWGAIRLAAPELTKQLSFDTGENRSLAAFPEKFDPKSFTVEVEAWYNDHLPFRSVLYKTQETMVNALELPYTETLRPALIKLFHSNTVGTNQGGLDPFEPEDTESETLPEVVEDWSGDPNCDHLLSEELTTLREATCTAYGVVGYPCEKCSYAGNKAYTAMLDHDLLSDVTEFPMCGVKYEETVTCRICAFTETRVVEKAHVAEKVVKRVKPTYEDYGYVLMRCADCNTRYRTELKDKRYYTDYMPPIYHGSTVFEGRDRWLYYLGDNTLGYYQGTNLPTDNELYSYLQTMTTLQELCDEKGIQLLFAVWPNKEEAYAEYMPSFEVTTQYKRTERIVDYITENSSVKMIYPLRELTAAKPYYETYFPYDTHWNNAGAFIGHQAMLEALGFETFDIRNMPVRELRTVDRDYGEIVYDSNTSLMYAPKNGTCGLGGLNPANYNDYSNFIVNYRPEVNVLKVKGNNGAGDIRHSTSDGPNNLNFVMLADSFRVMQLTYLERDFTDCYLCHRNQVTDPQTIAAIQKADVLVIAAVERYENDLINTANRIIQILSKK